MHKGELAIKYIKAIDEEEGFQKFCDDYYVGAEYIQDMLLKLN